MSAAIAAPSSLLTSATLKSELAKLRTNLRQDLREEILLALAASSYDLRVAASVSKEYDDEVGLSSANYDLSLWSCSNGHPAGFKRQEANCELCIEGEPAAPPDQSVCKRPSLVHTSSAYLQPPLSPAVSSIDRQDPELMSVSTSVRPQDLPGAVPEIYECSGDLGNPGTEVVGRKKRTLVYPRSPKRGLTFAASATSRLSSRKSSITGQASLLSNGSFRPVAVQDVVDVIVAGTVVLNGISFGLQTEEQAVNCTDAVSEVYVYAEAVFFVIFFSELVYRLMKHKLRFFVMPGCGWNWFDAFLVLLQVFDAVFEILFGSSNSALGTATAMKNMGFLRLLRILRLLRALRLVRLLQFFGELNVVTSAIASSLQSLCGTVLLLTMMIYIIGIIFTQIATTHRVQLKIDAQPDDEQLDYWWGSLSRGMLSLCQAILAGADWNDVVQPLLEIHVILGATFVFYIAFVLLAVMNVITGIFVESALKNADKLKDRTFEKNVRELYNMSESESEKFILKSEFRDFLQDETFQMYLQELGVELDDAVALLDFLDDRRTETISVQQLLSGLVRLRARSKFTDIMGVIKELKQNKREWSEWSRQMDARIGEIKTRVAKMEDDIARPIEPKPQPQLVSPPHVASPLPPLPCNGRHMLAPMPGRAMQCTEV